MRHRSFSALLLKSVNRTHKFFAGFLILLSLILVLQLNLLSQTTGYEMLVSSRNTHSVKRFNLQKGAYIDDFVAPGSGGLNTAQDVISGPDGNLLVSGRGNSSVLMFDKINGSFLRSFTSGYSLDNPTKISIGPDGNLYVSQWGAQNQKIVRFNGTTGKFVSEFTPSLNLPLGQAWDKSGNMYVACYGSGDVRRFDTAGNFTGVFTQAGFLQGPANLWFDFKENLFVVDWVSGSVVQFNAHSGAFIKVFISGLQNAEGYSSGPDGSLYICDWSQNNIKKYSPGGTYSGIFTNQGNMQAPNSILIRESALSAFEENSSNAHDFSLNQNYPNPFNPSTKIAYTLSVRGYVKLNIFDIRGNEIAVLIDCNLDAGNYEAEWQPDDFSSGVYFFSLSNSLYSITKKMIFLK